MEIVIYISLTALQNCRNLTFYSVVVFVFVNQSLSAHLVHRWYQEKFDDYPNTRKALLPWLWWKRLHVRGRGRNFDTSLKEDVLFSVWPPPQQNFWPRKGRHWNWPPLSPLNEKIFFSEVSKLLTRFFISCFSSFVQFINKIWMIKWTSPWNFTPFQPLEFRNDYFSEKTLTRVTRICQIVRFQPPESHTHSKKFTFRNIFREQNLTSSFERN